MQNSIKNSNNYLNDINYKEKNDNLLNSPENNIK